MNETNRAKLEETIRREYANTEGVVILQNGAVEYARCFEPFSPGDATHVFSVTKSVVSILLGIAIDLGLIQSVDQKVLEFFPDYPIKRGEKTIQKITLRDMLTMTAPYKYRSAPYTRYFTSDDWVKASLDLLGGKGTVGAFRYAPLIGPDILTGILARATGRPVLDFAVEKLFAPLEIAVRDNVTFHSKEEQLDIMKNRHERGWVADPKGNNTAGWGLFLTPMDMAKIGQLCLNRGVWHGRPIVSGAWIGESTSAHSCWMDYSYGYLWWVIDEREHSYAALGDGGNVIYVNPAKNAVVAIASHFQPRAADRMKLIRTCVEPMLEETCEASAPTR